jgi:iron(III) transport system substrate-binding protein
VLFKQEFERDFPGVTLNFVTARAVELIARIGIEAEANQRTWDVFGASAAFILLAMHEGKIASYTAAQATPDAYPLLDPSGNVSWFGATVPVVIYNTERVDPADVALIQSWEDLANPVLKKYQILMDLPSRGGPFSLVLAQLQWLWNDDAKFQQYLEDLADLNPRYFRSTGEIANLVISGEGDIGIISLLHDVLQAKPRGAPIDFIPISPVILSPQGLVINDLAPHPHAARLYVEWSLSRTGQLVFAQTLRTPTRLGLVAPSSLSNLFPQLAATEFVGLVNEDWLLDTPGFLDRWLVPVFGPG